MYCLKCGKETEENQAFCLDCQKEMKKYPVDPGVAVQLPKRKTLAPKKPTKRRVQVEDQIRQLRIRLGVVTGLLAVAIVAIACLLYPVLRDLGKQKFEIGQNYTAIIATTVPTVETTGQ